MRRLREVSCNSWIAFFWIPNTIHELHELTRKNASPALLAFRITKMQDDPESFDPDNPFPEPVSIPITDVFDLHNIQPREVKLVVEEYLKEALEAGFRSVRIIHGKGKGVQREMVRKILQRTEFVSDWTDAPPDAGGLGATIVWFK